MIALLPFLVSLPFIFAPTTPLPTPQWLLRYQYHVGDDAPCTYSASPYDIKWYGLGYYDLVRNLVITIGRTDDGNLREWGWDGAGWISRPITQELRGMSGAAYDADRHLLVSLDFTQDISCKETESETWEWDGENLIQKSPALSPPPRRYGHVAYDAARKVIVLMGGINVPQCNPMSYDDVWEYDGNNWSFRGTVPFFPSSPLFQYVAVYDSVRRVTWVVFVNHDYQRIDVWGWDGTHWFLTHPTTRPPYHRSLVTSGAVFHEKRERVVVYGWPISYSGYYDTYSPWEWDGREWYTYYLPQHTTQFDSLVYDPRREVMLAWAGGVWVGGDYSLIPELWEYGHDIPPTPMPFERRLYLPLLKRN
jgi:hypothetical protein